MKSKATTEEQAYLPEGAELFEDRPVPRRTKGKAAATCPVLADKFPARFSTSLQVPWTLFRETSLYVKLRVYINLGVPL